MGGAIKGRGWWVEQSKQYIEGEGQWVRWWVEQSKQYMGGGGGWSNQREGVVGGAIRTLYRRGGTVGGDGGWSNQSSDAHVCL